MIAGFNLDHVPGSQIVQVDAAIDLRLDQIVINPVAQISMRKVETGGVHRPMFPRH
jgi:hypothetical protein